MHSVRADYSRWKDLGPGGLPANPVGWLIATALRPLARDPFVVRVAQTSQSLWDLPLRPGPRPAVAPYPIPHRQVEATASAEHRRAITDLVSAHARNSDGRMHMSRSRFERRGDALFRTEGPWDTTPLIARGEIAHVHHTDGSLHVVAATSDAQHIIDTGWGELHPLAGRRLLGLPESYVLLYSPRDEDEVQQLSKIVERVVTSYPV